MIYVTQLVHVRPGMQATFHAFEDGVIPLLARYRGELLLRIRPDARSVLAASVEVPYEIHLVRFEREEDFVAFTRDEERARLAHMKDASVREALVIRGVAL